MSRDGAGPGRRGFDRRDALLAGLIGLGAFLIYLRTLAPGLLIDDSGEFQTMTRLLGHTHPPGYDVYTVVGRVFASIPVGAFTTRVSAFSALMGAVTTALVYLAARLLPVPKAIAAVPALTVAVSPTFWSQAIIAEVYTPAAALGMLVLVSILLWYRTLRPRLLVVAGAAGGLSLGVHFTIGLYLPAVAVFLLLAARERAGDACSGRVWLPALGGAAIGFFVAIGSFVLVDLVDPPSEYFEAVVAHSASAWGMDPSEIDGAFERLRFHWTARQFSSLMFADPGPMTVKGFSEFHTMLSSEFAWPVVATAALGVVRLLRRDPRVGTLILVALGTHLLWAFNYDIGGQIYVFYIPAYLLIALLFAAGLTAIARAFASIHRIVEPAAAVGVGVVAILVGVLPMARPNLSSAVRGEVPAFTFEGYPYDDYVATILHPALAATVAELPEDAIVFTDWELLYPYFWVAHVEQGRTDLMFHETFPADDQEGLAASTTDYVRDQSATRPVLVTDRLPELTDAGFTYVPVRLGPSSMLRVVSPTDSSQS